jgi:hypothetical protein
LTREIDIPSESALTHSNLFLTFGSSTGTNGLLWRNNRLYIPNKDTLRQDALYWHHDVPWMAHLGVQKTVEMVSAQFYWPLMQSDIEQYIETCHKCQSNKIDRRRNVPALSPLVPPTSCWRTVGVDLIVDLPQSQCGFNAVCVFVDHLSKMVRLVATNTTLDAAGFAKLYIKEVFPHYGFRCVLFATGDHSGIVRSSKQCAVTWALSCLSLWHIGHRQMV